MLTEEMWCHDAWQNFIVPSNYDNSNWSLVRQEPQISAFQTVVLTPSKRRCSWSFAFSVSPAGKISSLTAGASTYRIQATIHAMGIHVKWTSWIVKKLYIDVKKQLSLIVSVILSDQKTRKHVTQLLGFSFKTSSQMHWQMQQESSKHRSWVPSPEVTMEI